MNPYGLKGAPQKLNANYSIYYQEPLGQGAYGALYKGYAKDKNCIVAIKRLKGQAVATWKKSSTLKRQIEVLSKLNHRNILRYYETLDDNSGVYIITQYCDGGDLKKKLASAKQQNQGGFKGGPLSQGLVFDYLCQIIEGMAEVNRKDCMHRDLKPENIMLNQDGTIKIADFGLARQVIGSDLIKMEKYSAKGTPIYAAPNVIRGQKYSPKCDVWSCGLVIYELLVGEHYFSKATHMMNLQNLQQALVGKTPVLPNNMHQIFKELLNRMIVFNEETRVDFEWLYKQVIPKKAEWMKNIDPSYKPPGGLENQPGVNIKSEAYQTGVGMPSTMQTQAMMNQKSIEEQNYHKMLDLFKYTDFLYTRSRLMIDLMNRLNSSANYPMENGTKYTFIYIQMCIFVSTIDYILNLLSQNVITLPDGKSIIKSQLDLKSRANLKAYIQEYQTKLRSEKNNFLATFKQIASKLLSQNYKDRFPQLYQKYPNIYASVNEVISVGKFQSIEFYENLYKMFLANECRLQNEETLQEPVIKLYNWCIVLNVIRKLIPDSTYSDKDFINRVRETLDKQGKQEALQSIATHKVW